MNRIHFTAKTQRFKSLENFFLNVSVDVSKMTLRKFLNFALTDLVERLQNFAVGFSGTFADNVNCNRRKNREDSRAEIKTNYPRTTF